MTDPRITPGFAIICDRDPAWELQNPDYPAYCTILAMVDRSKTTSAWWTATDPSKIMRFNYQGAAVDRAGRLEFNKPRVVAYDYALKLVMAQRALTAEAHQQIACCDDQAMR